jgi:uncharacterized membrane protein YjgN (DUF898 family)
MPSGNAPRKIDAHPLLFTGRGGEYFRVWIVNVLLSLVTLGFYTPFARRRTAQYFYGHTFVAGSPLEFTAQPRKMFFGFLLLVVLYMAYQLAASSGNDVAANLLMLAGAILAPWLWGSAMRFRLASTRWRGVRLQFTASWREVYIASWPVFALAVVWIGVITAIAMLFPTLGQGPAGAMPRLGVQGWSVAGMVLLALVLSLLCVIRLSFNYQRLLVRRAGIGTQAGRWKPVFRDFVSIWLATVGMFLLAVMVVGVVIGGLSASMAVFSAPKTAGLMRFILIGLFTLAMLLGFLLALAPARAYREARMFKLVWGNIGVSRMARFKCRLRVRRYVGLRVMNMVLTLLTLGLYRPFARVSEYAMKVQSVTLYLKGSVDQLAGQLVDQQGALGDALADAAGLDLIG